ncbi:MAG TPA: DUF512 domain-containing protein [Candidatus Woesearchaeota archaeon]|nr:DUF512 domain-containing protein [Candidatus Woesearchaeota archaeon]
MGGGWSEKKTRMLKKVISSGIIHTVFIWNFGSIERLRKDFEIFKECIKELKKNHPTKKIELHLNYPSTTKYATLIAKEYNNEARKTWKEAINLIKEMFLDEEAVSISTVIINDLADEDTHLDMYTPRKANVFSYRIKNALSFLGKEGVELNRVGFITSSACYRYALNKFPEINWILAKNEYFGGDVVSAGLLTLDDIEKAVEKNNKFKYYIMSSLAFQEGKGKKDLLGREIKDFEEKTNSKVFLF